MMGDLNADVKEQAKPVIIHTLKIIGDMADNVLNEVTHTKKLCYECSKEYIDIALWLFPGEYTQCGKMKNLLSLEKKIS